MEYKPIIIFSHLYFSCLIPLEEPVLKNFIFIVSLFKKRTVNIMIFE